ncbi:hypothetical protein I4F81_010421 [Pyropia yezoensis]|uniref:Uncharacterized protein n=1 Tax=Pyropia yezoensis TaxID=2788 RepID=A0ACC3CD96_PYRYE|nr:hypothetical protein I4F81_010421 [Neopyropia yezoensis]
MRASLTLDLGPLPSSAHTLSDMGSSSKRRRLDVPTPAAAPTAAAMDKDGVRAAADAAAARANPYLTHSPAALGGGGSGAGTAADGILSGAGVLDNDKGNGFNALTGVKLSSRYWGILETRRKLPVHEARTELLAHLDDHQVLVLVGETGSGKTTQVPQFLVDAGFRVACTQPRRVAATSVAKRVAVEMDVQLGMEVGYAVRFDDCCGAKTVLKYLTDGMLLREAMSDPTLNSYDAIILDEAHERTLSTDVLMGLLKDVLRRRTDLKLIVMSATLDAGKFQEYFTGAPLMKVPGRVFPVSIRYTPRPVDNYVDAAVEQVVKIVADQPPGDVLVFLTGEEEIDEACRRIRDDIRYLPPPACNFPVAVLPLYASLPPREQAKVFDDPPRSRLPDGPVGRKIICATNVAETSLTIDGVVYVVDTGFSKQKVYNPRARVESLLVSPISRASAKQRAGRAGRTRPGTCYRLYTESAFASELKEATYPEILRSNLGNVVLQLKKLNVNDLVHFDFMDPPAPETLMRALELLNYLHALSDEGDLTKLGASMAELPLPPELSAALLASVELGVSGALLTIAAMLSSTANVFLRPKADRARADAARRRFEHTAGDHLTLLRTFNAYSALSSKDNARDRWCWDNYVNPRALQSATSVRAQLARVLSKLSDKPAGVDDSTLREAEYDDRVLKALLSGFFMQVAHRQAGKAGSGGGYLTVKDHQLVALHPGCGLTRSPDWVMYNEFVLTKRNFIRTVTEVRGPWLVELAPHYYDMTNFPEGAAKEDLKVLYRRHERKMARDKVERAEEEGRPRKDKGKGRKKHGSSSRA